MFAKRLSSMSATSLDGVGSSAVYKPSRIARRKDAIQMIASQLNPLRFNRAINESKGPTTTLALTTVYIHMRDSRPTACIVAFSEFRI